MKNAWLACCCSALVLQGATGYKVETRYPVPGNGGLDRKSTRLNSSHW
jgi:hypothetical protein